MSAIFQPLSLRGMNLKNRIGMSPMLMYAAGEDGAATDVQCVHYAARALGGVGLVLTEVVAVEPRGRISPKDLGLWHDDQIAGLRRLAALVRSCGAKVGIQLAHAGRKAVLDTAIVAPSAIPYDKGSAVPEALTEAAIEDIVRAYRDAAVRAQAAGFDCLEVHAGHGYLLHQFLAPISNRRSDAYGGSLENRARLLFEVVRTVRSAWPDDKPLLVRLSAVDLVEGGVAMEESVWLAQRLAGLGVDLIDVSTGNIVPGYPGVVRPGYQVRYAEEIRRAAGIPTGAVGSITSSELAEAILDGGAADLVFLGRELLRNPFWVLDAAHRANVAIELPIPTYARATGPYERGF